MIYADSRYADGRIYTAFDSRSGKYQISANRVFPNVTSGYYIYTWRDGDRLDVIAQRMYANSDSWSFIMDYNPEIPDALNITPGTQVRMPNG